MTVATITYHDADVRLTVDDTTVDVPGTIPPPLDQVQRKTLVNTVATAIHRESERLTGDLPVMRGRRRAKEQPFTSRQVAEQLLRVAADTLRAYPLPEECAYARDAVADTLAVTARVEYDEPWEVAESVAKSVADTLWAWLSSGSWRERPLTAAEMIVLAVEQVGEGDALPLDDGSARELVDRFHRQVEQGVPVTVVSGPVPLRAGTELYTMGGVVTV